MLGFDYGRYKGWLRSASPEDLVALAPNLREADKDEILGLTGLPPEAVLSLRDEQEEAYVGGVIESPKPELALGFVPITEGAATVWMVSTDVMFDHPQRFAAVTKAAMHEAFKKYPLLTNFIDARNTRHIEWLKWLGFKLIRQVPLGPHNLPFYEFVGYKECV